MSFGVDLGFLLKKFGLESKWSFLGGYDIKTSKFS